ncbi:acyl carrier protein [Andreprevotia lacus DSM 23236]|jgi:acyl carrier protein|uniref:Acyl carrier protein n=1 Tax=Andreprevotia lacus DSM 23236 TaxID=1121001 RepID=A0A1W1X3U5_9NEIS|nr:phosphopantetheine-binding protein [Andreprevotia lacus]SMC18629.1 acyl carrier protein [Andreprevotia lacus DSM 23236]
MADLDLEIKNLIIDTLGLEDISVADIDTDAPLFGDGLGLDSIDALELGVALQKRYGLSLSAESAETRQHFASVASLAAFVAAARTK